MTAEGVERAIFEFDRLGRDAFLDKYGFGEARRYFLIHEGRRYDSKAVVGVAHEYDQPDIGPLRPQDFSGGDATVARRLESLGFEVEKPSRNPAWAEEELILALDLYLRSGLLDAGHPDVQELSRVLNSLTVHTERPDPERFRNPNGVALKLANFAAIDPNHDGRGMTRGSKRDAEVWKRYASDEDALCAAATAIREGHGLPEVHPTRPKSPRVEVVAVEAQHVEKFQFSSTAQIIEGTRREQCLVLAYKDHLRSRGHRVNRHVYTPHETSNKLVCDLMDETCHVLYEAKGNVLRESVRMAIGQLLDYRRFEKTTPKVNLAVLLPRKPVQDLIDLIHSVPASVVWRTDNGFECSDP